MIKFKLIGINYLHPHPYLEKKLDVPEDHIIVDRKDWETVMNYLQHEHTEFTAWLNKNEPTHESKNEKKTEYEKYIKSITDIFVGKLTYNSARPIEEIYTPKYKRKPDGEIVFDYSVDINGNISYLMDEAPSQMDGVIKRPKDVVEEWRKIENDLAIRWLNKNIISYEEWLKNQIKKNRV